MFCFITGPVTRELEALDRNLKHEPRCDCGDFAKRDCGWTSRGSGAPRCCLCNERDEAETGLPSLTDCELPLLSSHGPKATSLCLKMKGWLEPIRPQGLGTCDSLQLTTTRDRVEATSLSRPRMWTRPMRISSKQSLHVPGPSRPLWLLPGMNRIM